MAQDLGGEFEELGVLAVHIALSVILKRLLRRHEGRRVHVGHRLQLGLEGPGLFLGEAFVHVGGELVFGLQVPQGVVQVDGHQGEGAHDDEAGHDHAHGGKGHQAVGKDAVEALFEVITHIILTHCCNTHPFRR